MRVPSRVETVVVGGGQAGLTMSALLGDAGRDHVVLERRSTLGGGWQDRWDSFCLVSPNWTASFPGHRYEGSDPDGFMPRDAIASHVAAYASKIDAPVALETEVRRLSLDPDGTFRLDTTGGPISASRVVVATGSFHEPRLPSVAAELPDRLVQIHTQAYRNESELPPGGVLVVGSGQSGVQIAEELADAGRPVYLSVGKAGRVPRRYRGHDTFRWLGLLASRGDEYGVTLPTVDMLPDPRARSAGNPHLSGRNGGHETNLRRMAADGMNLLGRIERVDGERIHLAGDLNPNLAAADRFFDERFRPLIESIIERAGIDAPPDDRQAFTYEPEEPAVLDLAEAGISTVVWATGYRLAYDWIDLPIFDEQGFPRHRRGVTEVPGLGFVGLLWQHTQASATLFGVALDARHVARAMGVPVRDDLIPSVV